MVVVHDDLMQVMQPIVLRSTIGKKISVDELTMTWPEGTSGEVKAVPDQNNTVHIEFHKLRGGSTGKGELRVVATVEGDSAKEIRRIPVIFAGQP
jgi:hypothetical protein